MKASEQPDYKKIFDDIIKLKYPDKKDICNKILAKDTLSILDVIIINDIIFGETTDSQKFRCYDKKAIFEILGICKTQVRLPLVKASTSLTNKLSTFMKCLHQISV